MKQFVPQQHLPYFDPSTNSLNPNIPTYSLEGRGMGVSKETQLMNNIQELLQTVNSNNEVVPIPDTNWSICWDSGASAIYYYNTETGEATWVKPTYAELRK